jgi:hypothetical protein
MRREWLGFLLAGLLVLPASAKGQSEEAQCRKRILVYLDVSLSMKAHYADALAGVDALFREPGFIGPTDAVTFVQFGKEREITVSGEGPDAASALIARLKSDVKWKLETDFRAAFTHLAEELPKGVFNRQVVLFASDFAHEPINRMNSDSAIADWQAALSKVPADLRSRFASSKKTKMLLYKAEASGTNPRATANRVIADLRANFSALEYVGNPSDLAIALRRSLLDPPVLQVSRDPEDSSKLRFTVTNPNCYPVHVVRISVEPSAGGEAVVFEVNEEDGELAQRGVPKTIRRAVPAGDEWRAAEVRATVDTLETEPGNSAGKTGNWLKFKAKSAVFERRWWPLRDVLRLDLDMVGYTDQATTKPYVLTFGEDAAPHAQAKFEAPAFSGAENPDYRIVLALKKTGEEAGDVRVSIGGAEALTEGGDRIALVEDARASHTNRLLAAVAGISTAALLLGFLWVRRTVDAYPVFKPGRRDYAAWVFLGLLGLALLLGSCLRVWLLRRQTPGELDQWLGVATCVVVAFLSALLILRIVQASFARSTVSERPIPLRTYLLRSRLGNGGAWIAGAVLAGTLALLWWQYRPAETQESRRNVEASSLHVTSD